MDAETINTLKNRLEINIGLIKMFFSIFMPTLLELEDNQFVCDFYIIHDAGKEDYLRPLELIGLDGLDFVCKSSNIEVVKCCQLYFGFELPSLVNNRRATKFDKRYRNHSNIFCHMISRL